jgi:hypothetical protein
LQVIQPDPQAAAASDIVVINAEMSDKQWQQYCRLVSKLVTYHGKSTSMVAEVKYSDLLDRSSGLHKSVTDGGSNLIYVIEQGNKSVSYRLYVNSAFFAVILIAMVSF